MTVMDASKHTGVDPAHRRVIFASSLGTVFEWYDFYLYGASRLGFEPAKHDECTHQKTYQCDRTQICD